MNIISNWKIGFRVFSFFLLMGWAIALTTSPAHAVDEVEDQMPPIQVELPPAEPSKYIDHSVFSEILKRFVNKNGIVDYRSFKRDKDYQVSLDDYLNALMKIDGTALEDNADRMSYWLNLYNGLILKEILKRYPVKTVAQIPHFFDEGRYEIAGFPGKKLSLLDIEQYFREKFNDPRLHLARVNGAMSSPPLLQEAFQATKLEKQLEEVTMDFLKDSTKNFYEHHRNIFYASALFAWFDDDFNKYLISPRAFIVGRMHLPPTCQLQTGGFDWKLNDTKFR